MANLKTLVVAALLALPLAAPAPAGAQGGSNLFSNSYNFLRAVRARDFKKVQDALNAGPTVARSADSTTGETALHITTKGRDATWMKFMLDAGADVNARDIRGATALHAAVDLRFLDGARMLIGRRADVNRANKDGETPLIRAVQLRDTAMVRLLLEAGADPDQTDYLAGMSARDYAGRDDRARAVQDVLRSAGKAAKPAGATLTPKLTEPS